MEGRVTHILGIAPYDGMQTAMERVAEEFPNKIGRASCRERV